MIQPTTATGLGVQIFEDRKKLQVITHILEEAASVLGHPSEHVRLAGFIDSAINESRAIAAEYDDILTDAA